MRGRLQYYCNYFYGGPGHSETLLDTCIAHSNSADLLLSNNASDWLSGDFDTEAMRCFATHDEDIDYFNMRIYIILIACVYIQQFNLVQ